MQMIYKYNGATYKFWFCIDICVNLRLFMNIGINFLIFNLIYCKKEWINAAFVSLCETTNGPKIWTHAHSLFEKETHSNQTVNFFRETVKWSKMLWFTSSALISFAWLFFSVPPVEWMDGWSIMCVCVCFCKFVVLSFLGGNL